MWELTLEMYLNSYKFYQISIWSDYKLVKPLGLRYQFCTRGNKEELLTALQLDGAETINTQSKLQQRVKSIVVRLKGNRGRQRQINRLALIRFAVEVGIAEVFVRSASANPCTDTVDWG